MARRKFLILAASGLVAAGGFGGVAAQAVSLSSADAPEPPVSSSETVESTDAPDTAETPVNASYIDEFFLGDVWLDFRQAGQLTMESCMAEGGFPFDPNTFDGMPAGLSEVDQGAWNTAAVPCRAERDAATAAAAAAFVPTDDQRAAALAYAEQYQGWIDEKRSCMADRGHEFIGDVDMTLQKAPFADAKLPVGMPEGLTPDEQHIWLLDSTGYDSSYPESDQSTWDASCGAVADAVLGDAGH